MTHLLACRQGMALVIACTACVLAPLSSSRSAWAAEAGDASHSAPASSATAPAAVAESTASGQPQIATITTARVRQGQLHRTLTVYGTVVPATGTTRTISLPYDAEIDRWTQPIGAHMPVGAVLGAAHPTADVIATRAEALASETAARRDVDVITAKHDLQLATQQDVFQAESVVRIASIRAAAWRTRCPDEQVTLTAPMAGMLLAVNVTAGQVVPAGTPLAVMVTGSQEARLGLEPRDMDALPAGALFTVTVSRSADVSLPPTAASVVSGIVDPETRLMSILVPMAPGNAAFGAAVSATVEGQGPTGLLVPRGALVRDDDTATWQVFSIVDSIAHPIPVTLLAESGDDAVVAATGLSQDQEIAVTGSGVLADGMRTQHEATPAVREAP